MEIFKCCIHPNCFWALQLYSYMRKPWLHYVLGLLENSLGHCFKAHMKMQIINQLIWRKYNFLRNAALMPLTSIFLIYRLKTKFQKLQVMTITSLFKNKNRKWCIKGRYWSKFFYWINSFSTKVAQADDTSQMKINSRSHPKQETCGSNESKDRIVKSNSGSSSSNEKSMEKSSSSGHKGKRTLWGRTSVRENIFGF